MYQIYILLFSSGHYYIGRSKDYQERYATHKRDLKKNKHNNKFMQSVYHLYGLPKCILLMYCIDCLSVEQVLIDYNYSKDKCLNLSTSSKGTVNVVPGSRQEKPPSTRENNTSCKIKVKDLPNLTKLLKMLPVHKVAKYYRVHVHTIHWICKKHNINYIRELKGKTGKNPKKSRFPENRLAEFILDAYKLNDFDLADKYGVERYSAFRWRKIYGINRAEQRIPTKKLGYKPKNRYIKKKDRVVMNPIYDSKK